MATAAGETKQMRNESEGRERNPSERGGEEEEEEEEEEGGISLEEASVQNTRRAAPCARRAEEETIGGPAGGRRVNVISDPHCLLTLAARSASGQWAETHGRREHLTTRRVD